MNYFKITNNDIANGEGLRVTLWLSGCNHHCKGCQNPQTWDVDNGIPFNNVSEIKLFEALDKEYISGITFSGGDPLHANNLAGVSNLINKFRNLFPAKSIWIYSGYTWEEIWTPRIYNTEASLRQDIIKQSDVFVDGRYIENLKNITLKWRGSSNQRVIDVQQSLKDNQIKLHTN